MSDSSQTPDALQAVNSATLGTNMPVVTLPDGRKVQTGTVGALILNIKAYDALLAQAEGFDQEKKVELEQKLTASLPTLRTAGIFDLFTPAEWINGKSPGRAFVGELAIKAGL